MVTLSTRNRITYILLGLILIILGILIYLKYWVYNLPKIAWIYWDTADLPPLINQIRNNNATKLQGWRINYLNKTALANYIRQSEYPKNFETLIPQHKADWIRLHLLEKHGGVWLDASIIINDPTAMDRLYEKSVKTKSQFTGFSYRTDEQNSRSKYDLSLYIENWFIMAPVNSIIIKLWLEQFEKAISMGFSEYKKSLAVQGIDVSLIYNDSDSVYLTQHAALQQVLQHQIKSNVPPLIIMPAERDMFYIRHNCKNNDVCTMETIRSNPQEARTLPYIKLVKGERNTGIDISEIFN